MPDDVPEAEKTRRIVAIQRLQTEIQTAQFAAMAGQVVDVLVDGVSRRRASEVTGRTSGNSVVNLPGPETLVGHIVPVRLTGHGPNSLRGEQVFAEAASRQEVSHAR